MLQDVFAHPSIRTFRECMVAVQAKLDHPDAEVRLAFLDRVYAELMAVSPPTRREMFNVSGGILEASGLLDALKLSREGVSEDARKEQARPVTPWMLTFSVYDKILEILDCLETGLLPMQLLHDLMRFDHGDLGWAVESLLESFGKEPEISVEQFGEGLTALQVRDAKACDVLVNSFNSTRFTREGAVAESPVPDLF